MTVAFPPSDIALWLDPEVGVTLNAQRAQHWSDRSGHNNDAFVSGVGPLVTSGDAGFNGRPVLRFAPHEADGGTSSTRLIVVDTPTMRWATSDFWICLGYRTTKPGGGQTLLAKQLHTLPFSGVTISENPDGNPQAQLASDQTLFPTTVSLADGAPHIVCFGRSGPDVSLRVDGVAASRKTFTPVQDVSAEGSDLVFANHPLADATQLEGDLGEVIAVAGPNAGGEIGLIESHLAAKYLSAASP